MAASKYLKTSRRWEFPVLDEQAQRVVVSEDGDAVRIALVDLEDSETGDRAMCLSPEVWRDLCLLRSQVQFGAEEYAWREGLRFDGEGTLLEDTPATA